MPEPTSTSTAGDSSNTSQATVPNSIDMDSEAASPPSNVSTISSEPVNLGQAAAPATAGVAPMPNLLSPAVCKPTRDSSWLELDICRDFQKEGCPRSDQCRFAHPESNVVTRDGKVTCCYDFLKVFYLGVIIRMGDCPVLQVLSLLC